MLRVRVEIRLKPGVVDPEGKNIEKALHLLDFDEVKQASVSRFIELVLAETDVERARTRTEDMCRRLLSNPVIHDYRITVDDSHA
jgi:phosphoribosylformylglycinamidine synthase